MKKFDLQLSKLRLYDFIKIDPISLEETLKFLSKVQNSFVPKRRYQNHEYYKYTDRYVPY